MYTAQQVASEIEQIKPNFTEFIKWLKFGKSEKLLEDFNNTKNMSVKLFKAQLIIITYQTHNQMYAYSSYLNTFAQLLQDNLDKSGVIQSANAYSNYTYFNYSGYTISNSFKEQHIANYITDVKKYLTPYLWNKIRVKTSKSVDFKELKEDLFCLTTFKNYLDNLKTKLPSTQVKIYVEQIKNFKVDIKQQYLDLLLGHVGIPSIDLQKSLYYLIPNQSHDKIEKFMELGTKRQIQNLAIKNGIPVPASLYDDRESDYKPFITNTKRKPTTDIPNISYLVGTAYLLKVLDRLEPNPVYAYFVEQINEHLKEPEYGEPLKIYLASLKTTSEVLGEYCDGLI
jgi:hypothetical protein